MKAWIKNNYLYLFGALCGGIAGYLYWQEIGCLSGSCTITSKPLNSTIYGIFMGALVFGLFKKEQTIKIT